MVKPTHVALVGVGIAIGIAIGCQEKPKDSQAAPGSPLPAVPRAAGPGSPSQGAEELRAPLAKIDDVTITIGELQERINRQSPYIRARYTSLEQKKEFLESLVRFEVLAKEATKRGLDRDPEVVRTMKQVMIQKLMRDEFDAKITADTVTDEEMHKYYDANVTDYVKPEEVRASAIVVKNKAQADRVLLEAKGDAGRTNKGFRDLVTKYSADEESKLRGGDLRYFSTTGNAQLAAKERLPEAVVKAGLQLANTGDVSGVIDAGNGNFYILKQTGKRRAMTKSFDDAKAQIRNKLFRDKRLKAQTDFVQGLRDQSKIEINEANLAKVRIDTSSATAGDESHGKDPIAPPPAPGLPPPIPLPAPGSADLPNQGNP